MTDTRNRDWTTASMLKACAISFILLTAIFLPFPEVDLWVSSLFYNGNNDFWLRTTEFNRVFNDYGRPILRYAGLSILALLVYRFFTLPMDRLRSLARYMFLILCVIVVNGFVIHSVLKDNVGRARPKQVVEFDGSKVFTPPLLPVDQCEGNCSFVSGDAAAGYALLALALYATRRRKFWILASLGAGIALGTMRLINGSHFLSDILFAGVVTCGGVLILYRWIEEKHWRSDLDFLLPIAGTVVHTIGSRLPPALINRAIPVANRFVALFRS